LWLGGGQVFAWLLGSLVGKLIAERRVFRQRQLIVPYTPDRIVWCFEIRVGNQDDLQVVACLDGANRLALFVEQIIGDRDRQLCDNP
jgi:hypothetical protein